MRPFLFFVVFSLLAAVIFATPTEFDGAEESHDYSLPALNRVAGERLSCRSVGSCQRRSDCCKTCSYKKGCTNPSHCKKYCA
uniref:Clone 773 transcribed RNA sequence n=1 Tax=Plectreurys tristis TaxID=33319 RepID=A0A0C4W7R9_PLETR|nr:venom peptide U4-PLTX-Pt1a [Plectreurys tristis]